MSDGTLNESPSATARAPICSIIAGATLFLCLFTPFFLVTLPVMATVGLSIAAAFRKEAPLWLPYLIGGLAVVFVIATHSNSSFRPTPTPAVSNSELYKDAKWEYGSAKDDMRGTVNKWATLNSPTDFSLDPPYDGANTASIQTSGDGSLIFTVTKGQLICNSDDRVQVRFDDGPIFGYPCSTPTNGQTGVLYIDQSIDTGAGRPASLVDGMLKAKKMLIEVQFYEAGYRQFTFNVAGLDKSKL